MIDRMPIQSASASPLPRKSVATASAFAAGHDEIRFEDVLAKSQPTTIVKETSKVSADQMWKAKPDDRRERRTQEQQEDYRTSIDRQSASRLEDRAGIKARRMLNSNSHVQTETTPQLAETHEASDSVEASPPSAFPANAPMQADSSMAQRSQPVRIEAPTEGSRASNHDESAHSQKLPRLSVAPDSPVAQEIQVAGSESRPLSGEPQAAREIARALTTNIEPNAGREVAPGPTAGVNGRMGQAPLAAEKTTNETKETRTAPRPPAEQETRQETTEVPQFEKLVRLVRASSGKQSTARVMLDPPELGKVHVRVRVDGDHVEIGVETENDAARQIIAERAARLTSLLEQNGFLMDRFDVAVNQNGLLGPPMTVSAKKHDSTGAERESRGSRRSAAGSRFETPPLARLSRSFDLKV